MLGLLALRDRRFARDAVLDWLADRPPVADVAADAPLPDVPLSAWERLSRRAQVLEGPQWVERFVVLARTLEHEAADRAARGAPDNASAPPDADYARAVATAIRHLQQDTRPPGDTAPWPAFVDWAQRLRARYLPVDDTWPVAEREAATAVDAALEDLRTAATFEPLTTPRTFREALAQALEVRRQPEGTFGAGVLVGPLGVALGATFERVYVLGLAEGSVPARPSPDPLTTTGADAADDDAGEGDPLRRHDRQRENDRRALLGAVAAVPPTGQVVCSYPRSDGAARAVYPSRWLLELLAIRAGEGAVYASDLPRWFDANPPWLERVASAYDGLVRCAAPADLADLRLHDLVAWHAAGRTVAEHPLAARADLPLRAALALGHARRSAHFTAYDGNLAELTTTSRLIARPFTAGRGASSATALERWAGCHYQYLLANVLRVEATERPEDEWTITPADEGILVHAVYEQFFRELLDAGRCTPDDTFTPADHVRLDEIAHARMADLEAQGRTGHPLAWELARARILADLHAQLARDEDWRRVDHLMPALLEGTFGNPRDPNTWPPAVVTLPDGTEVAFRGTIDRVDRSLPGATPRRALVIDYKTGGASGYEGLAADPVMGGRHVQLALYTRALRGGLAAEAPFDEVRAEYRFVSRKGEHQRVPVVAGPQLDAALERAVQRIATGVRAGVFLPVPGEADRGTWQNCRFCSFDRVCATTRDELYTRKQPAAYIPLESLA